MTQVKHEKSAFSQVTHKHQKWFAILQLPLKSLKFFHIFALDMFNTKYVCTTKHEVHVIQRQVNRKMIPEMPAQVKKSTFAASDCKSRSCCLKWKAPQKRLQILMKFFVAKLKVPKKKLRDPKHKIPEKLKQNDASSTQIARSPQFQNSKHWC